MKNGVEGCVEAVYKYGAVMATIVCFEGIRTAPSGRVPLPQAGEKTIGNHAITITGYSMEDQGFYFQNTWGEDWGDKGSGFLPFAYFDQDLVLEMYAIMS